MPNGKYLMYLIFFAFTLNKYSLNVSYLKYFYIYIRYIVARTTHGKDLTSCKAITQRVTEANKRVSHSGHDNFGLE